MNNRIRVQVATYFLLAFSTIFLGCSNNKRIVQPVLSPTLTVQNSNSDKLFIGTSMVNDNTVWISGTAGSFGRTTDGGETWEIGTVPGADSLQFRDIHGVNARIAYILSIGNGDQSRIYKTVDAGYSWTKVFQNAAPEGFFDCMDFWSPDVGMAFSDSYDGSFLIVKTIAGGLDWDRISPDILPPALDGEGSFAASGTCLKTVGENSGLYRDGRRWESTRSHHP